MRLLAYLTALLFSLAAIQSVNAIPLEGVDHHIQPRQRLTEAQRKAQWQAIAAQAGKDLVLLCQQVIPKTTSLTTTFQTVFAQDTSTVTSTQTDVTTRDVFQTVTTTTTTTPGTVSTLTTATTTVPAAVQQKRGITAAVTFAFNVLYRLSPDYVIAQCRANANPATTVQTLQLARTSTTTLLSTSVTTTSTTVDNTITRTGTETETASTPTTTITRVVTETAATPVQMVPWALFERLRPTTLATPIGGVTPGSAQDCAARCQKTPPCDLAAHDSRVGCTLYGPFGTAVFGDNVEGVTAGYAGTCDEVRALRNPRSLFNPQAFVCRDIVVPR